MAKKNSILSASFENGVLSIVVEGAGSVVVNVADLTDGIRERAMIHGLTQKLSDAAAIARAELPADPAAAAAMKLEAIRAVADRLRDGDWSKRNGEGAGPVSGLIFRAYAEFAGNRAAKAKKAAPTLEAIRAIYDAKTRSEQLALRNVPEIAEIIERMKAERGTPATAADADSLLAELGL